MLSIRQSIMQSAPFWNHQSSVMSPIFHSHLVDIELVSQVLTNIVHFDHVQKSGSCSFL